MTPLASRLLRHVLIFAAVLVMMVSGLRGWVGIRAGQKMNQALARAEEHWGVVGEDSAAPPTVPDEDNGAMPLRGAVAAHGLPTSSLAATNWVSGMLAIVDDQPAASLAAIRRQLLLARSLREPAELMSQVVRLQMLSGALDLVKESL
ncbi:MAG: hypothetical protein O7D35_06620, partial [Acidobacteria bacterium]|nr:hypothetical protein [Acidobacteriota bacterium]